MASKKGLSAIYGLEFYRNKNKWKMSRSSRSTSDLDRQETNATYDVNASDATDRDGELLNQAIMLTSDLLGDDVLISSLEDGNRTASLGSLESEATFMEHAARAPHSSEIELSLTHHTLPPHTPDNTREEVAVEAPDWEEAELKDLPRLSQLELIAKAESEYEAIARHQRRHRDLMRMCCPPPPPSPDIPAPSLPAEPVSSSTQFSPINDNYLMHIRQLAPAEKFYTNPTDQVCDNNQQYQNTEYSSHSQNLQTSMAKQIFSTKILDVDSLRCSVNTPAVDVNLQYGIPPNNNPSFYCNRNAQSYNRHPMQRDQNAQQPQNKSPRYNTVSIKQELLAHNQNFLRQNCPIQQQCFFEPVSPLGRSQEFSQRADYYKTHNLSHFSDVPTRELGPGIHPAPTQPRGRGRRVVSETQIFIGKNCPQRFM